MDARLMPIAGAELAAPVWLGCEQALSAIALAKAMNNVRPSAIGVPQKTLLGKQLSRGRPISKRRRRRSEFTDRVWNQEGRPFR
jgi:hypothetical protein